MSLASPRLIEKGFPCHQVGAETRRERDTGKAPPPHRLHVWWARRPLVPSRAAVLGSILEAEYDHGAFLQEMGLETTKLNVGSSDWIIAGDMLSNFNGLPFSPDTKLMRAFNSERY